MDEITLYHNPACGTSRNTLALLRRLGVELHVVEYLKTPPSRDEIVALAARCGVGLRELVREKGTPFRELGLDRPDISDDELLDAIAAHPILLNRPIVVSARGVKLCRPSDVVLDLLAKSPPEDFDKEEGAPFLIDGALPAGDPALAAALAAGDLPVDDLAAPGRTFFAYRTLGGTLVGYGGFELFGPEVLLRSVVVLPTLRGRGIGRNLVPLLMRRAFDRGARRAWLLTTSAAPYFEKIGFARSRREVAPPDIATTSQFTTLCPASAVLLSRSISF